MFFISEAFNFWYLKVNLHEVENAEDTNTENLLEYTDILDNLRMLQGQS